MENPAPRVAGDENRPAPDPARGGRPLPAAGEPLEPLLVDEGDRLARAQPLTHAVQIQVSTAFSARTEAGELVYELHDRELRARPGTPLPRPAYVRWHTTPVFKGMALTA